MTKTTEQDSLYQNIESLNIRDICTFINEEDKKVAFVVEKQIPQIQAFVEAVHPRIKMGGRLIYVGAGTSGRLGVLDASEIPPTFGTEDKTIVGIIAGGDTALRKSVENAEDDEQQAMRDLDKLGINSKDALLGLTASGSTPYVMSACRHAKEEGAITGGLSMNIHSPLSHMVDYPIEVIVGPEFITGSTRMKSGTAQKMVLNMISTSLMILQGRVHGNKMSHLQLSNNKLKQRGILILQERFNISEEDARLLITNSKNLAEAVELIQKRLKNKAV